MALKPYFYEKGLYPESKERKQLKCDYCGCPLFEQIVQCNMFEIVWSYRCGVCGNIRFFAEPLFKEKE